MKWLERDEAWEEGCRNDNTKDENITEQKDL